VRCTWPELADIRQFGDLQFGDGINIPTAVDQTEPSSLNRRRQAATSGLRKRRESAWKNAYRLTKIPVSS
jgi:hypothetical protein